MLLRTYFLRNTKPNMAKSLQKTGYGNSYRLKLPLKGDLFFMLSVLLNFYEWRKPQT